MVSKEPGANGSADRVAFRLRGVPEPAADAPGLRVDEAEKLVSLTVKAEFRPEAFTRCGTNVEDVLLERIAALGDELGIDLDGVLVGIGPLASGSDEPQSMATDAGLV